MTWVAPTACGTFYRACRARVSDCRRISAVRLPGLAQQPLLPGVGRAYDGVEVVQARAPAELRADALGARDQCRRVPESPGLLAHREPPARHPLDTRQHLTDAVAMTVAHVEGGRCPAAAQVVERVQMGGRQVLHVDVVAHAGAVGGR